MERGFVDADSGGHVFKKRVAIQGKSKSGDVRKSWTPINSPRWEKNKKTYCPQMIENRRRLKT